MPSTQLPCSHTKHSIAIRSQPLPAAARAALAAYEPQQRETAEEGSRCPEKPRGRLSQPERVTQLPRADATRSRPGTSELLRQRAERGGEARNGAGGRGGISTRRGEERGGAARGAGEGGAGLRCQRAVRGERGRRAALPAAGRG